MNTGRRKDDIWKYFIEVPHTKNTMKSKRAVCKRCKMEMNALVARMRTHYYETCCGRCDGGLNLNEDDINTIDQSIDLPEISPEDTVEVSQPLQKQQFQTNRSMTSSSSSINKFVVRTSEADRRKLDMQVAKFIFATNTAFRAVEHAEFLKLISMLRPGYTPPNRRKVSDELLNNVFDSFTLETQMQLKGKTVCMALDGWSNIRNESIVCVCVTDMIDNVVYLFETIDTKDNSHTSEYLLCLTETAIKKCESFGCIIGSVVTDNAANMKKMRQELATCEDISSPDIVTYGCSAHILNLLAHDIEIPGLKSHIKQIFKYFRNSHFFSARYKMEGGKALVLPQDVRWNTLADTIQCYLDNWHILFKLCDENRTAVDKTIFSKVNDVNVKHNSSIYLKKLKKIAISLDQVQKDNCTIGEACDIWLTLKEFFETEAYDMEILEAFNHRIDMVLTEYHYIANILDHRFIGSKLSQEQTDTAMDYINHYHPNIMAEVITYQAQGFPFKDYLFSENTKKQVKPLTWWLSLEKNVSKEMLTIAKRLHSTVASSAGIERIFSSFGIVHTTLRNRLGVEKSSKLVSVFKSLNPKQ